MQKQTYGAWLVLLSTVFYASHGVWSKWLNPYFDEFSTSVVRSLVVMALLAPVLIATRNFKPIPRKQWKWLAATALPGGLVTPMYFYSFKHLSVGVATLTFFAAYSLAAVVFGVLFFGERLTRIKLLALCLGLIGLVLITGNDLGRGAWLPVLITAIAGICGSCEVAFSKKLSGDYSVFYLTFLFYLSTLFISLPFFIARQGMSVGLPTTFEPWALSVGYALAIIAALWLAITGYKHVDPGIGGIVGLAKAVFGVLFGALIFHEVLTWGVVGGMVLILVGAFMVIRVKPASNEPGPEPS